MSGSIYTLQSAAIAFEAPGLGGEATGAQAMLHGRIDVLVTSRIEDVEAAWRQLTSTSIESPGQSFDFIRLWVADRKLPESAQFYVLGLVDGQPVALLPLHRKRVYGMPIFTWFPGANAGCYAPVADMDRLAALGSDGRAALWSAMTSKLSGAGVVYLRSIPVEVGGHAGLFDQLGSTISVETLYRSHYSSWAECDTLQRSKTRRKHDRQQGDRLAAMGEVTFCELRNSDDTDCAIETMFQQRSARFEAMGIRDPFVHDRLIGFYHQAAKPGSGVDVRLHVLRLNGDIVAVRYNVVHHRRMFCLISSMTDDPEIQHGSPGKQCLLHVMQTVFDQGFTTFDMGSGFTDEKRHWCNVQTPLRQHYIGLTPLGALTARAHQNFQRTRAAIKAHPKLKSWIRNLRHWGDQITGAGRRDAVKPSDPSE
ncbi:Acetyltransferase involved in cellulose biosynthesis, CelD/BcsL family [Devosia sp. YR412]|uniref:GNAT family N-acetyltransferase n=1 Tax=Devosia sp. YR412 TaxID=1881030 RepID=UPI0008B295A4|nr:GNAT family N-acetyltransferase [Devosia sp. YR412]SEP96957.1 Acetyltransferase involved in cellulose biosynthesis, CelD/BcsL family [Devosia sp. YR412]